MATSASSNYSNGKNKQPGGLINKDHGQTEANLSGLKHALHGTSYQLKLGIVVCLANAKKLKDPANQFSFTVTAEDATAGKFDDVVYKFQDGEKTGILKIQAKHKLGSPAPTITLTDLKTTKDSNNQFGILKYFTSFYDQQEPDTDLEGLIICSNSDIDDNAKAMLKIVKPAAAKDSAISLDFYILTLFEGIGGKCYRLDYDKAVGTDGMFSSIDLLRKCSKRTRLAKLLVESMKSKKKITCNNFLYKAYRQAILKVIDSNEISANDTYKFTKEFLNSSIPNSKQGYEAFRKEFEDQYRQEFKIVGSVWEDLQMKRLHVAKDFLSDEKNEYASSDLFPDDDANDFFKAFCDRFRLVCGTKNEHELDDAITELWKNLYADDNCVIADRGMGCTEEKMVTEKLFKTNFDWLMDPFANPLYSEDIKLNLEKIEHTLAHMKLKGISNKLRKQLVRSPFRISHDALKASDLYDQIESESLLDVEAYDIHFGVTVISDIFALQSKALVCTLFLDKSDLIRNSDIVKKMLDSNEHRIYFIIICNEACKADQSIIRQWKKNISKDCANQLLLIRKTSDIPTDLSTFNIHDLTEETRNHFLSENIFLCGTTIAPAKILQNYLHNLSIEEVFELLNLESQVEENNQISRKYREIKACYVHRYWIEQKYVEIGKTEKWNEPIKLFKYLEDRENLEWDQIRWVTETKLMSKNQLLVRIFNSRRVNNSENEQKLFVGDSAKKVLILLGEAGCGKSTNLTWLAWYLRKQNPSSWVVRCNLSDYCNDFREFIADPKTTIIKNVIDERAGLRLLFKMVQSSIQLERANGHNRFTPDATYLDLSNEFVTLNEIRMKEHDLSLINSIQLLVFKEKFNSGELVLLLDAFDEITPHYKEVVLQFLSQFEQFKGVSKLYVTSRPYGFKEHFKETFKDLSFFQLKPLSLQDKGSMLYTMIQVKWHNGNIDDKEISVFYKWLCTNLLCSLRDMSDVPLNLVMAVDILRDRVGRNQNINKSFFSKRILIQLFETIKAMSKASFIVEEFVKMKIRYSLYDKIGANNNADNNPREIDRFGNAIEEVKGMHGLVALWVLFDQNERDMVLTDTEMRKAKDYMNIINEAREKTGLTNGLQDGIPMFIHQTFVEYLAAWWIVHRRIEGRIKICDLESFWKQYEMRKYIDGILAKSYPLHLAIIDREWGAVKSLLSTKPEALYERDDGNRTPMHLLAFYDGLKNDWANFLPENIEADIINCKEKLFGWSALDCAFHMKTYDCDAENHQQFIFYLLHHGASINVEVIFEQVVSAGKDKVRKASRYAKFVMEYLSRQAVVYETHDACKQMKHFCEKVVAYLVNKTSVNIKQTFDHDYKKNKHNEHKHKTIAQDAVLEDSMWMLESAIQLEVEGHFVQMVKNEFYNLTLEKKSIFLLKFFMANDPSILSDDDLWKCVIYALLKDYKNEFKYFFDLYCSRSEIKDFQPCSIQCDEAFNLVDNFKSYAIESVCGFSQTKDWTKLAIPIEIVTDKNLFSLMIICMATGRQLILMYLKETCKVNLCTSLVYPLAIITSQLFVKIYPRLGIIRGQVYECLLNQASSMSDAEATKLLRLAMTSDLLVFSKCLIKRYKIDFHAVDEANGWNVFHLFVSRPRINYTHLKEVMLETVSCMLNKTKFDCFGVLDRNGKSILHLAIENQYFFIAEDIVARKLGVKDLYEIDKLDVDAVPNLILCYRAMHEILKSVEEKGLFLDTLSGLANQIAKILLTIPEESQNPIIDRLVAQENAEELYKIAMKYGRSILMFYLHREFPSTISVAIYTVDWLKCTAKSLKSPDFLEATKWLLNVNVGYQDRNLYSIIEKWEAEINNLWPVNFEKLSNAKLSANRSEEEVCKMKLLISAVCFKNLPAIRYLCENFDVSSDQKILFEIMQVAHQVTDRCDYDKPDFDPIHEYLLNRTSNLFQIDAEGNNVLHLAVRSGLGCMAKFLIEHNIFNVMTINELNRWNIFHFYASRKRSSSCCYTSNYSLLSCISKRILEITSDTLDFDRLTESHKNKIKELCFNSNEVRKGATEFAIMACNIATARNFLLLRLGINKLNKHKIKNSDEWAHFIECYDELNQLASQIPFTQNYQQLLNELARPIDSYTFENVKQLEEQDLVEDACRSAIEHRCVSTLEHLITVGKYKMDHVLTRSSSRELFAFIMECIRRNRSSLFQVLLSHYFTLQGFQPSAEVDFEKEENDNNDGVMIDEIYINWFGIGPTVLDQSINQEYLLLLILSAAYRRLSMIRYLDEMFQSPVNKSLILSIIIALKRLNYYNRKAMAPAYEYLVSKSGGKLNLLHIFAQVGDYDMVRYLIEEKQFDPNEIDPENGWNAGHYSVSEPANNENLQSAFKVFELLMNETNMNWFSVYDQNGRNVLHLAIENGHTKTVECIIHRTLGMQPLELWDMEKLDVYIKELNKIMEPLPIHLQRYVRIKIDAATSLKQAITTYYQTFKN